MAAAVMDEVPQV